MSLLRTLPALLLLAPTLRAAELATLEGKKLTGDIVAITGNELTFKSPAGEEKFLVTTLHSVITGPTPKAMETGKPHTTVELIDGSLFRCSEIVIKGEMVELKLLPTAKGAAVRSITVPMRPALYAVNREAGNLKLEQDFRNLLRNRGRFDQFVFKKPTGTDLDAYAGTFGAGDSAAGTIKFKGEKDPEEGDKRLTQLAGMIFAPSKVDNVPPAICKIIDSDGNELVAQAVTRTATGYAATLVSGVKVELAANLVSKFDFAAGAIKFLSDLDPVGLDESGTDPEHYQRDKTLDKRPIRLMIDPAAGKGETYPKGLTLKAKTVITYELKGAYKVFRAVAGVDSDPENLAPSQVKLTIDDGTAILFKGIVKKGDKATDLNLNVTNVDRLKITVESDGSVTDLGNQVSLGNARVLK
ncbi:MAG TPA: NPCBM/NEW2 domain-containing protein [Gemmataceae bacterium]|nr:NPCBM/NEW2 domain-containing protein [Gemmataceae bacterium]